MRYARLWVTLAIVGGLVAACTVLGDGVDAPVPVPDDYAAREAAAMKDSDRCGPEFIQTKLPEGFVNVIGPITDGPFRPVCARHDACYRIDEKTQAWCDDRMREEMNAICESGRATPTYSVPLIGPSLCRFHAGLYYRAIDNTFGAVAFGGLPGGEITALRIEVIDDVITDDELTICVDVTNTTPSMQEYDVELHDDKGRRIDREPDTYEVNVRAGQAKEFCVGTNYSPRWGISDLSDVVYVSVRADTPENFATRNDMVIVDTRAVRIRGEGSP